MATRTGRTTVMGIGLIALVLITGQTGNAFAADQAKPEKKPKASPEAKAPKAKADKPTVQTAEKAGKTKACFGEAPKIEKLSPRMKAKPVIPSPLQARSSARLIVYAACRSDPAMRRPSR